MHRTTILLPEKLKSSVNKKAHALGLSLGEFVRKSLELSLKNDLTDLKNDPFVKDKNIYLKKIKSDASLKHDDYIYGKKR